ncbi:MAG: hypothetical protein JSW67_14115 [Candidatus Latescibacterota bacterium]|nr:MAG: hypothetical protein JSW67_14115 [Candidatus Latescibacterota bacterium]
MKVLGHITLALLLVGVHPLLPRSCGEACAAARPSASGAAITGTDLEPVAEEGASCCGPSCCCGAEETKPDLLAMQWAPCSGNAGDAPAEDSAGAILVARIADAFAQAAKPTHPGVATLEAPSEFTPAPVSWDFGRPPPSNHRYDLLCSLLI